MILIIGGAYQGKTEFAIKLLGADKKVSETDILILDADHIQDMTEDVLFHAKIITNFHVWTRECLNKSIDLYSFTERFLVENPNAIVVCNELGCGLVPIDAADRTWREETGRICGRLAEEASAVYRVFAGIGTKIK